MCLKRTALNGQAADGRPQQQEMSAPRGQRLKQQQRHSVFLLAEVSPILATWSQNFKKIKANFFFGHPLFDQNREETNKRDYLYYLSIGNTRLKVRKLN